MSTNAAPRKTVLDGLDNALSSRAPQLWQVPTFFAGVLALLIVAVVPPLNLSGSDKEIERDLAILRRGLAQANPDLERLLPLADDLLNRSQKYPQAVGEIHFLVGTAYMRQADRLAAEPARSVRAQALAHLEQAEARGVPAADKNRLYYRLGRVVYLNGGDLQRAIGYMNRGCPLGGDDAFEGYGLLVQGYLKLSPPDLDAALRANQKQIELSDDDAAVASSRLQRAELLLKKDLRSEALKALDAMSRKAPRDLQMRAKALQARCCQEDGLYSRAAGLWQELLMEPSVVPGGKGRILYMLGLCHEQADPPSIPKARKAYEEAMACGGEEAQAAALRLADSMLGSDRPYTALPHFQFAVETVSPAAPYQNSLIDLDAAREMFERGCRYFRQQRNHITLKLLAEAYQKIALPGIAEERQAEAAEEHGKHLRDRAKTGGPEAAPYLEKARAEFRRAAQAYEVASQTRNNHADYLQRLARSADCWVQAQEYPQAEERLRKLLGPDVPPAQQTEAWFALAKVYQALQKPKEEVQKCYHKCIEYHIEPFANNALLQLGMLAMAAGNYEEAEIIFKQALNQVNGASLPCEDVFVRLADLYIKQEKYDPASVRLKEAIRHYPNSPHLFLLRDKLGDCYRKLADQDWSELKKNDPLSAGKKSYYWDKYRDHLDQAREVFQKLADDLELLSQARQLTNTEDVLWRKALFVAADCLKDLGNSFGEVLRRYEELARRNQNRVEGLMACQRLLSCYNAITEDSLKQQARKVTVAAFENARAYLPAIPESDFQLFPASGTKHSFRVWLDYYHEWFKTH